MGVGRRERGCRGGTPAARIVGPNLRAASRSNTFGSDRVGSDTVGPDTVGSDARGRDDPTVNAGARHPRASRSGKAPTFPSVCASAASGFKRVSAAAAASRVRFMALVLVGNF